MYYYCYEAVKSFVTKQGQGPIAIAQSMISGTVAGAAVVIATHPIWTVNVIIKMHLNKILKTIIDISY